MPSPTTADALNAHLRQHHHSVLAASAMALIFSAFGWAVLYGALYWVTMLVQTVRFGGDVGVPKGFDAALGLSALGITLAAAVDAWLNPHERAVDDRPALEHFGDILLFVPRLTLAAVQNFRAWPRLSIAEIPIAATLLDRLRADGRVALHTLPLDFPQEKTRARILVALQVVQLAEVRPEGDTLTLSLHPLAPETFRTPLRETLDALAKLPHARANELPDAGRLLE